MTEKYVDNSVYIKYYYNGQQSLGRNKGRHDVTVNAVKS